MDQRAANVCNRQDAVAKKKEEVPFKKIQRIETWMDKKSNAIKSIKLYQALVWKVSGERKYTVYCCKITLDSHKNWETKYCKCYCIVLHIMLFLIDFLKKM